MPTPSPNAGVGLRMSSSRVPVSASPELTPGPTLSPRIGRAPLPQNNTGVGFMMTSTRPKPKKQLNDNYYDLDLERLRREKIINDRMSKRYGAPGSRTFERFGSKSIARQLPKARQSQKPRLTNIPGKKRKTMKAKDVKKFVEMKEEMRNEKTCRASKNIN
ncbi:hypothetical protein TrVE_jg13341 [Triparma verrucosa]|uniref:Uncharacterized protein n=1 Tax=Triparma verrucosa TaxID=1606542 RepID=A0A9W7BZS7_9STRA|nr:hypothetical protein TrVE_jg13341 [Triparma verrucosa]